VEAADAAGGRFLVVDPNIRDLSPDAARKLGEFYRTYGFEDLEDSNRMYVTIRSGKRWPDRAVSIWRALCPAVPPEWPQEGSWPVRRQPRTNTFWHPEKLFRAQDDDGEDDDGEDDHEL
jgi:hypothetical protein